MYTHALFKIIDTQGVKKAVDYIKREYNTVSTRQGFTRATTGLNRNAINFIATVSEIDNKLLLDTDKGVLIFSNN